MCKACKMDSREIAKFRERQGAVDVDDFEKEVNYQTRMKRRGNKRKRTVERAKPGCPGNDYGPHIYIWTTEGQSNNFFSDYYGFFKYEYYTCCGCGKSKKSRLSEKYEKIKVRKWAKTYGDEYTVKRGEPVSRRSYGPRYSWWTWENHDPEYIKAYREYIDRHGWPKYLYNFGW